MYLDIASLNSFHHMSSSCETKTCAFSQIFYANVTLPNYVHVELWPYNRKQFMLHIILITTDIHLPSFMSLIFQLWRFPIFYRLWSGFSDPNFSNLILCFLFHRESVEVSDPKFFFWLIHCFRVYTTNTWLLFPF